MKITNPSTEHDTGKIIDWSKIRLKQTPIPLSGRTRFKILIKQTKQIGLKFSIGHQRCSLSRIDMPNQVPIISSSIVGATSNVVAIGGPTSLADDEIDVGVAESLHGGMEGVHHTIKHVGVGNFGELVVNPTIWFE